MVGNSLEPFPQDRCQCSGQQYHEPESKPPQACFFLLQVSRGALRAWGAILFRSHKKASPNLPGAGEGPALLIVEHDGFAEQHSLLDVLVRATKSERVGVLIVTPTSDSCHRRFSE